MPSQDQLKPRKHTRQHGCLWIPLGLLIALLAGLLALTACGLLPYPGRQPAALPTLAATAAIPTPSATSTNLPQPQPSSTPTVQASPTAGPAPTQEFTPTPTPTLTATPQAALSYQVQVGAPWYLPAFNHTGQGCQWVGLAGQVFDDSGQGAEGVLVTVKGQDGEWMGLTAASGPYGPGGYEIGLRDGLPEQAQSLSIQLFDLQGRPLSEPFTFALPNSCERNLALVNFQAAQQKGQ